MERDSKLGECEIQQRNSVERVLLTIPSRLLKLLI